MSNKSDLEAFFPLQEVELADPNERTRKMRKKDNQYDLTADEKAFLKSASSVPEEIRQRVARQHDHVGLKVSMYRKLAAQWTAEANAIMAGRELDKAHGEAADAEGWKNRALTAESREKNATRLLEEKDRKIEHLTAAPSMAVFSED